MFLLQQETVANDGWFRLIIDLIVALSNYAWPAVVVVALLIFRAPLTTFIGKIRKFEAFGVKNELEPVVDELQSSVTEVQEQLHEKAKQYGLEAEPGQLQLTGGEASLVLDTKQEHDAKTNEERLHIQAVLDDAKKSPELALIRLSGLLETESKAVLGSMGFLPSPSHKVSGYIALNELERRGLLPVGTGKSLRQFFDVRNRIVHGKLDVTEKELLRVIDIGINLLKVVNEIQHENHVVLKTLSPIYSDPDLLHRRDEVIGVTILSASSMDNYLVRSFHTTLCDYYEPGKRVAWEWDQSSVFEQSWYKDESGLTALLPGSLDFVGRKVEDL